MKLLLFLCVLGAFLAGCDKPIHEADSPLHLPHALLTPAPPLAR